VNQSEEENDLDSIAFSTDLNADNGLDLTFYIQPPIIRNGISQRAFEVPLDGVSVNNNMFVFFSTDHRKIGNYPLMGRSVLTRSENDGYHFDFLYEFSRDKFINVSIERATLTPLQAAVTGLGVEAEVLWIWGSGRYRSSDIYLAVMPLAGLEKKKGVRYFSGSFKQPKWSVHETDATSLFCSGNVGELSVRWNQFLGRYLALYNSEVRHVILMHSAPDPWGPWSVDPIVVFDPNFTENDLDPCSAAGFGRFIHRDWNHSVCDHVQDDMFESGSLRDYEQGDVYGPYQVTPFSTAVEGGGTRIYFTMSTWNPYQVMLMTTVISNDCV
jgi:Domain of unknown function (DUF4185)